MARISVRTAARAEPVDSLPWLDGRCRSIRSYCSGANDPVHLAVVQPESGARLRIAGGACDRLGYVWSGAIEAGGAALATGSSFVVERGAALELTAGAGDTRLAVFSANRASAAGGGGGHVHLLPVERVPRIAAAAGAGAGTSGALHADGRCPSCSVWLNENSLPGQAEAPAPEAALRGVHAHPEDEIIFVTAGRLRLGGRLVEPGAALIIAADTLYGFAPGPEGVSFITFRPTGTTQIRFAAGGSYAPSTYFDAIAHIPYLAPPGG